jgi:hypothetical protein
VEAGQDPESDSTDRLCHSTGRLRVSQSLSESPRGHSEDGSPAAARAAAIIYESIHSGALNESVGTPGPARVVSLKSRGARRRSAGAARPAAVVPRRAGWLAG